jgi:hypothetical protein
LNKTEVGFKIVPRLADKDLDHPHIHSPVFVLGNTPDFTNRFSITTGRLPLKTDAGTAEYSIYQAE